MGMGSIVRKQYRTKRGYYLAYDEDRNLGGKFAFLIEPLNGTGGEKFFYVKALPNGHYEISGEGYIISKQERVRERTTNLRRELAGRHIYYFHIDTDGAVIRKEQEHKIQEEKAI